MNQTGFILKHFPDGTFFLCTSPLLVDRKDEFRMLFHSQQNQPACYRSFLFIILFCVAYNGREKTINKV
jgi:hypothetical protein